MNPDRPTPRTGGRQKNSERATPRVDAWLRRLRAVFDAERGAQSDCARFLAGSDDVRDIRNRVSMFSRWFRRVQLPDGEHLLAVEEWMGKRRRR